MHKLFMKQVCYNSFTRVHGWQQTQQTQIKQDI